MVDPERCAHAAVRWNPLTVEDAPKKPPSASSYCPIPVGHFLRQIGKCVGCDVWLVRSTDVVAFSSPSPLRALIRGVDPR